MSLVVKNRRCSICGSSEITEIRERGIFSCRICGGESDHTMNDSDAVRIMQLQLFGASDDEITELRTRYPNLGITTWSSAKKLEIK